MRLLARSGRLGLVVDFDGTISHIAPTPGEAVVSQRAAESMRGLVRRLGLVSVMSGRTACDVRSKVGVDGAMYVGNHGVEYLDRCGLSVAPGVAQYREKIVHVFDHLKAKVALPGLLWDDKRYSASVHYRRAADPAQARHLLATALDSDPGAKGLEVFWGKMVMEIRAPTGVDKGYALRKLVGERRLDTVFVLGDDITDLDAFIALRELRARGELRGAGVVVLHDDSPEPLVRAADYALNGVPQVEAFLEWLDAAVGP